MSVATYSAYRTVPETSEGTTKENEQFLVTNTTDPIVNRYYKFTSRRNVDRSFLKRPAVRTRADAAGFELIAREVLARVCFAKRYSYRTRCNPGN